MTDDQLTALLKRAQGTSPTHRRWTMAGLRLAARQPVPASQIARLVKTQALVTYKEKGHRWYSLAP